MLLILLLLATVGNSIAKISPVVGSQCTINQVIRKITVYEDGALEAECGPVPCGEVGRRCIDDQTACRAETDVFSGMRWAPNGESVLLRCCTMKTPNKIYVGTDIVSSGSFYEGGTVAKKEFYTPNSEAEYDFIANARTEQGGVRIWVHRIICGKGDKPISFEPITTTTPLPPVVVTRMAATTTTTMAPIVVEDVTEEAPEERQQEEETSDAEESNDGEDEEATEDQEEEEEEEPTTTTTLEPKPFNPLRYRPPVLPRA